MSEYLMTGLASRFVLALKVEVDAVRPRPRLRIPLGEPFVGAVSGFVWLDLSESLSISLNSVSILAGAGVTGATNAQTGAITVTAPAPQGHTVLATNTVADDANPLCNGRLRAISSSRRAWAWYDYDALGREICRIEQLDGSSFPETLSEISTNAPFASAARITATSYEPSAGDSCHANDRDRPRRVETFVCPANPGGTIHEPIKTQTESWRYTRSADVQGVPLRTVVHTRGLGDLVASSMTTAYPDDAVVSADLRGRVVSEMDEDGVTMTTALTRGIWSAATRTFAQTGDTHLRIITRRTRGAVQAPTYAVRVETAAHRLVVDVATCLTAGDAELDWTSSTYDDVDRLRLVRYSDGTFETNAYSCCRLLSRTDRRGRTTLRSATTGTDRLYWADEEVGLAEVSTNQTFRVTRHFCDAFGRETNTVVSLETAPGAAAAKREPSDAESAARTRTTFAADGSGNSLTEDARGRVTMRRVDYGGAFIERGESVLTNGVEVVRSKNLSFFGGDSWQRREWGGAAFTDDGRPTRTTWARGAWRERAYGERGLVVGTTYSDTDTPAVSYTYSDSGKVSTATLSDGTSVAFAYDGTHLTNRVYTLPNANVLALQLTREPARRELVTQRVYTINGQPVYSCSTDYDLLGRPTNAVDSISRAWNWLYNRRSELVAATIGTNRYGYAYDSNGNRQWSAANAVTNAYVANNLNQYTSILRASATLREPTYDADGNLTNDCVFAYAYDAENRLVAVYPLAPAAGSLAVENAYDHRHRRVRKTVKVFSGSGWSVAETHVFVWDGNNIVLEKIALSAGHSRVIEYFWGPDKSGTEQGAGGVGGLLAVSENGVFYIPCYDHNGNIVCYVSETGSVAAEYVYDPYGNVIEASGTLPSSFNFGFSTKYHDREIGMIAYQRRFYRPDLARWLNRDPIEEKGGENLYAFCENSPVFYSDVLGESFWGYFSDGVRMLAGVLSFVAGTKLTFATGGVGGVFGGTALMAYGLDQIQNAYENMKSRYQGRALPPGTFIQQSYREMSYNLTGEHGSTLESVLDFSYRGFEMVAACATAWASVTKSVTVIREVKPLQTVGRWTTTETGVRMVRYQFSIEGGVSGLTAAGVVAVETFNVSINVIGLIPPPEVNTGPTVDIFVPNDFTGRAR